MNKVNSAEKRRRRSSGESESEDENLLDVQEETVRCCKNILRGSNQPNKKLRMNAKAHVLSVNQEATPVKQECEGICSIFHISTHENGCLNNSGQFHPTCCSYSPFFLFQVHFNGCSRLSAAIRHNLDTLPEDVQEKILSYLPNNQLIWLFFVSLSYLDILKNAQGILKKLNFRLDVNNFETFASFKEFHEVRLRNISVDFKGFLTIERLSIFLTAFESSVENLQIHDAKFRNFSEFSQLLGNLKSIKSLSLHHCGIDQIGNESLPALPTLQSISFEKCNDNIFKAFMGQSSLTKIEVSNEDWSWNGFAHDFFNVICNNCENLDHIVLNGAGTGSYFDADEFPYKIRKLETSMITFHWYVGITSQRISFLESQKGSLKELTIHQLPNDFDGGRVLKYIIDVMELDTFYYGKIPLILNGKKQNVTEFPATEIQIKAAMELIQQFETITSYCLILSTTDIASSEIEKAINPRNSLWHQLKKFEVIDNSKYRGLFGVFLGLLKNLVNIEVLSLNTQDRNINVLLEESLPFMTELKELSLTSTASRSKERFNIIKSKATALQKLSVADQFVEEARAILGSNIEICGISS